MLIDFGPDIVVIFNNKNYYYYYIPLAHLQHYRPIPHYDIEFNENSISSPINGKRGLISFRNTIENAIDILIQLNVTGDHKLCGYITDVLSDYIIFNSPIYKSMAININHIKWLALMHQNQTFYTKGRKDLQIEATLSAEAASTLVQQLNKMIGKIVILDMGLDFKKVGLLAGISNNFIELIDANEETNLLNISHIKMFHI